MREQIRIAKTLTARPFGLNIMLMSPHADALAALAAEEKVAVVTTGAGNPPNTCSCGGTRKFV